MLAFAGWIAPRAFILYLRVFVTSYRQTVGKYAQLAIGEFSPSQSKIVYFNCILKQIVLFESKLV